MDMTEARRLGDNLEKSLSGDFKKCLKESWEYFRSLVNDPDAPDMIKNYIRDHFRDMKASDFEGKPPMYLIIDVQTVYDMIKLYEGETGHNRIKPNLKRGK